MSLNFGRKQKKKSFNNWSKWRLLQNNNKKKHTDYALKNTSYYWHNNQIYAYGMCAIRPTNMKSYLHVTSSPLWLRWIFLQMTNLRLRTTVLYLIPKLHTTKNPQNQRQILGSSTCSTIELFVWQTKIFPAVYVGQQKCCTTFFTRVVVLIIKCGFSKFLKIF